VSWLTRPTLESSFAAIAPREDGVVATAVRRLRERFQESHRAYHNEEHTIDVLSHVFVWSEGKPPHPLVIAALYHDAIYDPTQKDNERKSAELCRAEMSTLRVTSEATEEAVRLILLTTRHHPEADDRNGILLCDADLYILGTPPDTYTAYQKAIRAEYAHVPESAWRNGRKQVLESFLKRTHIFYSDWKGLSERETQARTNLSAEISRLSFNE
jgi:predicted metal-dependent HD superfamily phosphohydrolase